MSHMELPHWLTYAFHLAFWPADLKQFSRSLTDNTLAWHMSQRIPIPGREIVLKTHGIRAKQSVNPVRRIGQETIGPRVVLEDQVRTSGWVLAAHGGFMTHFHHDAEGFGTFIINNCGAKIWALSEPHLETPTTTREDLYKKFDMLVLQDEPDVALKHNVAGTLLLEHGDIL
jgi:hypothetical protein